MYSLMNISSQVVVLLKKLPDNQLLYQRIGPGETIDIEELAEYINLANLIDPKLGLFKISIAN